MNSKQILCVMMLVIMAVISSACSLNTTQMSVQSKGTVESTGMPNFTPEPIADSYATFNTNMGTFKVRLYGSKAPITVKNFEYLVKQGFYKGLTFHRVIDGFMIQGGDPAGNGTGGPGDEIPDEFSNDLHFNQMGVLAMANRGPNTGGSQFFITLAPTDWLENKHTIFGVVVQGMDVVINIGKVPTNEQNKPTKPVIINSIVLEPIPETKSSK